MIKRVSIDKKFYDVIDKSIYDQNRDFYINAGSYALEDRGIVYPIRKFTDTRPGYYQCELLGMYEKPSEDDMEMYSAKNIIDFSNIDNIKGLLETNTTLKNMEKDILTTPDNIFIPPTSSTNTPEMAMFKEAVTAKHIDIDKYEDRFGPSFDNDKRLFKKDSITLGKLKDMCNALDIKVTLAFEDKNPNVPNPMNTKLEVEITSADGGDENESDS